MTRAGRQVGEASRQLLRGAGQVRAPPSPRVAWAARRGPRAVDCRVPSSEARAAPALGPGRARAAPGGNLGPGFLPPPRAWQAVPLRGQVAAAPRRGLAWQVTAAAYCWGSARTLLSVGAPGCSLPWGPILFWLSWFFSFLVRVVAECQVSRIPVRQSSPSHARTVGGCLAAKTGVLTAEVEKC